MAGTTLRSQDPPRCLTCLQHVCRHTYTHEQPLPPSSRPTAPGPPTASSTARVTASRLCTLPPCPAALHTHSPAGPYPSSPPRPGPARSGAKAASGPGPRWGLRRRRHRAGAGVGGRPREHGPARGPSRPRRDTRRQGLPARRRPGGPPVVRGPDIVGPRAARSPTHPRARPRPPSPASTLAGPLRGSRRPRLVGQPRPEVPRKLTVSPSDGLGPWPRYLHLGTGALVRLRPSRSLSPPHPPPRPCGRVSLADGLKVPSWYDGPTPP